MNLCRILISLLLLAAPAFAADVPKSFAALIAGRDLAGWQDAATAAEHWKIENGELINDGKGTDLVTARSYRNFELRLEWKIPPTRGSSGCSGAGRGSGSGRRRFG